MLSAAHCREQQALQQEIADNHPLESRRKIGATAVKAWSLEAVLAEKREAKKAAQALSDEDAAIAAEFADEDAQETMRP